MAPGCQGSQLPGPWFAGGSRQLVPCSGGRTPAPGTALHGTPRCRNPTPRPTALVSSVTSLVCWKQPQQPSGAGAAREVSTDSSALFQGKERNTIPSHLLWWPCLTSHCLSLRGSGIVKPCKRLRNPATQGRKVRIKMIRTTDSQTPLPSLAQLCPFPSSLHTVMNVTTLRVLASQEPSLCSHCLSFLPSSLPSFLPLSLPSFLSFLPFTLH